MDFKPTLHKLSNGVTVILDPMDIESVNVRVYFETGSRDEQPSEYGLTHFCEHMLCRGTHRFPDSQYRKDFLENNGGYSGAGTNLMYIQFHGRIIAENLDVLIDVIADEINDSLFDEKKIEIERNVVLDELHRNMDNKGRIMSGFVDKSLFGLYVPNGLLVLGNPENIKSFTRDQMLDFVQRRLTANNCEIIISGKIKDLDATLAQLEKVFAGLPKHDVSKNTDITYTPTVAHDFIQQQNTIYLDVMFPEIWPDLYENRFKNKCVRKFETFARQELMKKLRHEMGLVYGVYKLANGNEQFCVNGFGTQSSPENIQQIMAIMSKTLYDIYTNVPITTEDLIRFRNAAKLGDADFLESASERAGMLWDFYHRFGKVYDLDQSIRMSESITVDDIRENTRGYFDGQMSIITHGAKQCDADLKQIWVDNFK